MFPYVFSIVLVVIANVAYHIIQKSTPAQANPFASLLITYLTAAAVAALCLFFTKRSDGFLPAFKTINWTSLALGAAIVGLELGFMMVYRTGWNISIGSLVANIALAMLLIPIGLFFFRESLTPGKLVGIGLCVAGLICINR